MWALVGEVVVRTRHDELSIVWHLTRDLMATHSSRDPEIFHMAMCAPRTALVTLGFFSTQSPDGISPNLTCRSLTCCLFLCSALVHAPSTGQPHSLPIGISSIWKLPSALQRDRICGEFFGRITWRSSKLDDYLLI